MKISVAQANASLTGPEPRFAWLKTQVAKAAQNGADLVVFPELFMSGYNVADALHDHAEPQNGPYAQRIQSLAKAHNIAIAYGYPERDGNTVYNAFLFIDSNGTPRANHRKTVLPLGIESDWFATGTGFPVFKYGGATLAMVICYECEFPEILRSLAQRGANIVLISTAGGKDWAQVPNLVVPTRAYENGIFIAYANYCGTENGHGFCGRSCIVGPSGTDLARAEQTADLITADLDLTLIAKARAKIPFLEDQKTVLTKLT